VDIGSLSPPEKETIMRTLKQKWAFERCFRNKGILAGALSNLNRMAYDLSTLRHEEEDLLKVCSILSDALKHWDDFPTQSWKLFERRSR